MGMRVLIYRIAGNTFAEAGNTAKFAKVFTRESFRLYGTYRSIQ